MSMPSLAIEKSSKEAVKCIPNLLPCKLHHDGPVNGSERYWKSETEEDDTRLAYFRGRKLHGRSVKLPEGYKGAVLQTSDKVVPTSNMNQSHMEIDEDEEEEDEAEEIKLVEQIAEFDEIMVWGHETTAEATEDPYSKGMEEWISFAEAIHAHSASSTSQEK
ncbi:ribonuclease H1 small subunit [Tothia fuscella]|uniref:Ribonuclease H1 small subunit n=1 Tax=Tothia fuscella TaxID=1048955 RepID=A0A9P4NN66_9PEZI|nr:ribonuclease H1 small subunit [Tothia fuscella]